MDSTYASLQGFGGSWGIQSPYVRSRVYQNSSPLVKDERESINKKELPEELILQTYLPIYVPDTKCSQTSLSNIQTTNVDLFTFKSKARIFWSCTKKVRELKQCDWGDDWPVKGTSYSCREHGLVPSTHASS